MSSKIQILSHDSSSIKIKVYSDRKGGSSCFLQMYTNIYNYNTDYYPVGVSHTHLNGT